MKFPIYIHKSIKYSAEEIDDSIRNLYELPGCYTSSWSDGSVIADPHPDVQAWSRNKDDYRCEFVEYIIDENNNN